MGKKSLYEILSSRNYIRPGEGKLTILQFLGFILISLGFLYFAAFLISSFIHVVVVADTLRTVAETAGVTKVDSNGTTVGGSISIAFFTVMLGVALAFPDLLKGQTKDISTMRIIVFMFANVICMLLLKMGWEAKSLSEIGLDGYWMGVIAFLFGAKATQYFFENAKSIIPSGKSDEGKDSESPSAAEVAKFAVEQHEEDLEKRFSNIESVSDQVKDGKSLVVIYLHDDKTVGLPSSLAVKMKDGTIDVPVKVVADAGDGKPHIGQSSDELSDSINPNYLGSVCCVVKSTTNPNFKGVVTSGHIFTKGDFIDYGSVVAANNRRDVLINGITKAKLFFQQMKYNQDLAIAQLIDHTDWDNQYRSFANGYYTVTESDIQSKTKVTVESRPRDGGSNVRDAFILDFNVSFVISYKTPSRIRNIILIGSTNDLETSQTVSQGGDSGSCVYDKQSKKLIGILLGGNNKFTFVLPIQKTLEDFNFKPL